MNEMTLKIVIDSIVTLLLVAAPFVLLMRSLKRDSGSYAAAAASILFVLWAFSFGPIAVGYLLAYILPVWAESLAVLLAVISWPLGCLALMSVSLYFEERATRSTQSFQDAFSGSGNLATSRC